MAVVLVLVQGGAVMDNTNRKIYRVELTPEERQELRRIVDRGKGSVQYRHRAHILLLADEGHKDGGYNDRAIAGIVGVGIATPERVRRQCVVEGVDAALSRKEQVNRKKRILDGKGEAELVRLACSKPPSGRSEWTLQLLGDRLVELEIVDSISRETVRRALKKRPEALAREVPGHTSPGECRFRLCHGGCA